VFVPKLVGEFLTSTCDVYSQNLSTTRGVFVELNEKPTKNGTVTSELDGLEAGGDVAEVLRVEIDGLLVAGTVGVAMERASRTVRIRLVWGGGVKKGKI
jgi:hypothetical protein